MRSREDVRSVYEVKLAAKALNRLLERGRAICVRVALYSLRGQSSLTNIYATKPRQTTVAFTAVLPKTGDRRGRGSIRLITAGGVSRKWRGVASITKSYAKSETCATPTCAALVRLKTARRRRRGTERKLSRCDRDDSVIGRNILRSEMGD